MSAQKLIWDLPPHSGHGSVQLLYNKHVIIWNQSCGTQITSIHPVVSVVWIIWDYVWNHTHRCVDFSLLFSGVWLGHWLQRLRGYRQRRLAVCSWFSSVGFLLSDFLCHILASMSIRVFIVLNPISIPVSLHEGHIMAIKQWRILYVGGDGPGNIKSNTDTFSPMCTQWSQSSLDVIYSLCLSTMNWHASVRQEAPL